MRRIQIDQLLRDRSFGPSGLDGIQKARFGLFGVGRVARARPDGYTIEFGALSANVLNGAFYSLSYDLLGDLTPISLLTANPWVLYARASLPAKDLKELIAWLRANPNKASAASPRSVTAC